MSDFLELSKKALSRRVRVEKSGGGQGKLTFSAGPSFFVVPYPTTTTSVNEPPLSFSFTVIELVDMLLI